MSSLGRGRGWVQTKNAPLPRPGRPYSPKDSVSANAIYHIERVETTEKLLATISYVRTLIDDAVQNGNLKTFFEELHEHTLNNKDFGRKLIAVFKDPSFQNINDNEGKPVRRLLINALQTDYETREKLRKNSAVQFRNAILLLWEVYSHIKIGKNSPIKVLEVPLLDYLEMLLETHTSEDIQIFTDQITVIGQQMYKKYQAQLDKLVITAREILIKEQLTPGSRKALLYVIDLANCRFKSLPRDLQNLYASLGRNFAQCPNNDLANNATIKAENDAIPTTDCSAGNVDPQENLNSEIESIGKALREPILEGPEKIESLEQQISQRYYPAVSNNRTLRAIRGSGAADVEKETRIHGNENMTSTPKQSSNNKGWGDDGRRWTASL